MEKEEIKKSVIDSGKVFFSKKELIGTFAKFAIIQSPYLYPDNILKVIGLFSNKIEPYFQCKGFPFFLEMDYSQIKTFLKLNLECIPDFMSWNNRKNGKDGNSSVSIYDGPKDPDNEFIDLDAIYMNIAGEIVKKHNNDLIMENSKDNNEVAKEPPSCTECGLSTEFHTCPYQEEMFNNYNPICACCAYCERQCRRDI